MKYTKEFKNKAIKLSDEIGVANAAKQLNIPFNTLADWRKKDRKKSSGKDYGKIPKAELTRELEQKDHELEQKDQIIKDLQKEIEDLKTGKIRRELIPLMDVERYNYSFNYAADSSTGKIVEANALKKKQNFTNLYRIVSQILFPVAKYDKKKKAYYLDHHSLSEIDDSEFKCLVDVMKQIIDVLYLAKSNHDNRT